MIEKVFLTPLTLIASMYRCIVRPMVKKVAFGQFVLLQMHGRYVSNVI